MLVEGNQNIYATLNPRLDRINPLWGEVEILPLQETLSEYGISIPALDYEAKQVYYNPEATAKLMIENDPTQVLHYLRSHGIFLENPSYTELLDVLLSIEEKRPGFIFDFWNRFNPLVTQENKSYRSTRLIKSYPFWANDVPYKFKERTLELRRQSIN